MPLSKKHLEDKCLLGESTSRTCRYLAQDEIDWSKHYCLKKSGKKSDIDVETSEFIEKIRKKGKDPFKENIPLGDNCGGYPILKHTEQGYDQKT